jgi:bilirubin oxidase
MIQDRSFNSDGSLFYPDNRAFFEGLNKFDPANPVSPYLDIPFMPTPVAQPDGTSLPSDVAPIWNPEFFGNTMVVNGKTWPYLNVEGRRYRFRFLNGSDSRFLILTTDQVAQPLTFWQVGADGGFLPTPAPLNQLLIGPAERADVVVDFSGYAPNTTITLLNVGPDEPFGGGVPCPPGQDPINNPGCGDFAAADSDYTGRVMQFRVVPRSSKDTTLNPTKLKLPAITPLGAATQTIKVSLNEEESKSVRVTFDGLGNLLLDQLNGVPFGPSEAMLGSMDAAGFPLPLEWMQPITENPALGATAVWEIYNFTADAHPIHIHQVQFEVVNREGLVLDPATGMSALPATPDGVVALPEVWETGTKDTVIVYPGSLTRVKAKFDIAGLYVWHCHILSHEDNEMMRPFRVGP